MKTFWIPALLLSLLVGCGGSNSNSGSQPAQAPGGADAPTGEQTPNDSAGDDGEGQTPSDMPDGSGGGTTEPPAEPDAPTAEPDVPDEPQARAGESTDVILVSDVDGENISFTVHEPTSFVPDATYPLILHSHGYGGSKTDAAARPPSGDTSLFARLLDAGYPIISIDQRGSGNSGGQIRVLDPDFEGKDNIQIIDWAEANLDYLAKRDDNLVLGAIGSSYGGGYQHLILAYDPLQRLDAIAPEITWHDLRYSLFSNSVFKSFWSSALTASAGQTPGGHHQEINEGLAQGQATNNLDEDNLATLRRHSMAGSCEDGLIPRVEALYWQSVADTLFNLNEALRNHACVSALGGDVRLLTKIGGHETVIGGPGGEHCGSLDKNQSIVDWFDEKLRGMEGRADYIPDFCWHLDISADDAVVTDTLPVPVQSFQVPSQMITAQEGSAESVSVLLTTIGGGGAVIAGVPSINISITDPAGLNAGDPIIFAMLAKREAGTMNDVPLQANQQVPFRGYLNAVDRELVGVSNRLAAGDEIRLVISSSNAMRYPTKGSAVATPVNVEAMVGLPLLPGDLPAPPDNTVP